MLPGITARDVSNPGDGRPGVLSPSALRFWRRRVRVAPLSPVAARQPHTAASLVMCRISRPVDGWRGKVVGMRHVGVLVIGGGAALPSLHLKGLGNPAVRCLGVIHQVGGKDPETGCGTQCRLETCRLSDFLGTYPAETLRTEHWRETTALALDFRVRAVQRWIGSGSKPYIFLDRDCDRVANVVLRVRGVRYHGQAWLPFVLVFSGAFVYLAKTFPGFRWPFH